MTKLKPCPFCGGEAKVEYGRITASVVCSKCHIGIFRARKNIWETWLDADEAIKAWNRRVKE